MAKIELIKKTDLDGYVQYYVKKDGEFVRGTVTNNIEKAHATYNSIKAVMVPKIEVLKSEEI